MESSNSDALERFGVIALLTVLAGRGVALDDDVAVCGVADDDDVTVPSALIVRFSSFLIFLGRPGPLPLLFCGWQQEQSIAAET